MASWADDGKSGAIELSRAEVKKFYLKPDGRRCPELYQAFIDTCAYSLVS
jgi:hypothetical protein